jgi:hypothetical protein
MTTKWLEKNDRGKRRKYLAATGMWMAMHKLLVTTVSIYTGEVQGLLEDSG